MQIQNRLRELALAAARPADARMKEQLIAMGHERGWPVDEWMTAGAQLTQVQAAQLAFGA